MPAAAFGCRHWPTTGPPHGWPGCRPLPPPVASLPPPPCSLPSLPPSHNTRTRAPTVPSPRLSPHPGSPAALSLPAQLSSRLRAGRRRRGARTSVAPCLCSTWRARPTARPCAATTATSTSGRRIGCPSRTATAGSSRCAGSLRTRSWRSTRSAGGSSSCMRRLTASPRAASCMGALRRCVSMPAITSPLCGCAQARGPRTTRRRATVRTARHVAT